MQSMTANAAKLMGEVSQELPWFPGKQPLPPVSAS